ncbi:MAG: hypothetical protein ACYDBQ_02770 [Thermoplasmatota archaeon]
MMRYAILLASAALLTTAFTAALATPSAGLAGRKASTLHPEGGVLHVATPVGWACSLLPGPVVKVACLDAQGLPAACSSVTLNVTVRAGIGAITGAATCGQDAQPCGAFATPLGVTSCSATAVGPGLGACEWVVPVGLGITYTATCEFT